MDAGWGTDAAHQARGGEKNAISIKPVGKFFLNFSGFFKIFSPLLFFLKRLQLHQVSSGDEKKKYLHLTAVLSLRLVLAL